MGKTSFLDWALFSIRLIVGLTFVMHGGQKLLDHFGYSFFKCNMTHGTYLCIAPLTEVIGGGLILTGFLIELGTLLIIPGIILLFIFTKINAGFLFQPGNLRFLLNLMMLAVVIGICGPGKWALWDPGKTLRKKFLNSEE